MPIVENGTSYSEQIEVDENGGVVIFRVPDHNDVDAADFYYDFKMVSLLLVIKAVKAGYLFACNLKTVTPGLLPSRRSLQACCTRHTLRRINLKTEVSRLKRIKCFLSTRI